MKNRSLKSVQQMQERVMHHLQAGLQKLEAEDIELVIIAVERRPQAVAALAGTVRTPLEVFSLLVQALKELRPSTKIS